VKGPNGGARPGAGRKKGGKNASTLSKEAAREALRVIVLEHMREMTAAQIAHAKGLSYLVGRDRLGKFKKLTSDEAEKALAEGGASEFTLVEVWEKDPSVQAFSDLMNRALDKPKEQEQEIKVTGEANLIAALHAGRRRAAER
jgi:hypothetical protein